MVNTDVKQLASIGAYKEIVNRPLFSPNRRPPKRGSSTVVETIDIAELEDLVIYGAVISNETKYAIVGYKNDEDKEQLKEGHRYKGWRVSSVTSESVKFESGEGQYEIFISPNITNKKQKTRKKPVDDEGGRSALFRSPRQKNKSPLSVQDIQGHDRDAEVIIDQDALDQLGEEGGYQYDPDEDLDGEYEE